MARDYGAEAQQAAEGRLAACWEAMWAEDAGEEAQWPEDLEGPFCGCSTCEVREALSAAWPLLLEAAREEVRREIAEQN